jgi:hypothetical protein
MQKENENWQLRHFVDGLLNDGPPICRVSLPGANSEVVAWTAAGAGALAIGGIALALVGLSLARILFAKNE